MKIYLAASFERRPVIRGRADQIWNLGHEIMSSWLQETRKPSVMDQPTFFKHLAEKDLSEIRACDMIILETSDSKRGGKEAEWGFSLAHHGIQKWLVGKSKSVFHQLADKQFKTWDACLKALRALK